jgi:hypothetical protein
VQPDTIDRSKAVPDEDDVFAALDYLVSIEPDPPPATHADWKAALAAYETQIARALATLRTFAEQTDPLTLEEMQRRYYGFVNDPRYLVSSYVQGTVIGYLNKAWHGVGPWQR